MRNTEMVDQTIYLFGGWDGNQDLADFWSYHIPTNRLVLACFLMRTFSYRRTHFAHTSARHSPCKILVVKSLSLCKTIERIHI